MSLIDRTNETIPLALHRDTLYVDVDQDSSVHPEPWIWISPDGEDDFALRLTFEEAGLMHDRLGLILGRPA